MGIERTTFSEALDLCRIRLKAIDERRAALPEVERTRKQPKQSRQPAEDAKATDWKAYMERREAAKKLQESRRLENRKFFPSDNATPFDWSQTLANVRRRIEEQEKARSRRVAPRRPVSQPEPCKRAEAATCEPAMVRTVSELVPATVSKQVDTPRPVQEEQPRIPPQPDRIDEPTEPQPAVPVATDTRELEPEPEAAQPELEEGIASQAQESPESPVLRPQPQQQVETEQVRQQPEERCSSPAHPGSPVATAAPSPRLPPALVSFDPEPTVAPGPEFDDLIDRFMTLSLGTSLYDTAVSEEPAPPAPLPAVVAQTPAEWLSTPEQQVCEEAEMTEAPALPVSTADVVPVVLPEPVAPALPVEMEWATASPSAQWIQPPAVEATPFVLPMPPQSTPLVMEEAPGLLPVEIGLSAAVPSVEPFKFKPCDAPMGSFDFGDADYPDTPPPVAVSLPSGGQQHVPQPAVPCLLAQPAGQPGTVSGPDQQTPFTFSSAAPPNVAFSSGGGRPSPEVFDFKPAKGPEEAPTTEQKPTPTEKPADERVPLPTEKAKGKAKEVLPAVKIDSAPAGKIRPATTIAGRPMAVPKSRKAAMGRRQLAAPEVDAARA